MTLIVQKVKNLQRSYYLHLISKNKCHFHLVLILTIFFGSTLIAKNNLLSIVINLYQFKSFFIDLERSKIVILTVYSLPIPQIYKNYPYKGFRYI